MSLGALSLALASLAVRPRGLHIAWIDVRDVRLVTAPPLAAWVTPSKIPVSSLAVPTVSYKRVVCGVPTHP